MNPGSILVVDDEPQMLRYVQTLLEVESFQVETATSGLEALDRVQIHPPPQLVILDVAMPGLDGLETLERLRQIRPSLKVVMLSCISDPRTVARAIRSGAQDYLPKPFRKEDLDAVIHRCLGPTGEAVEMSVPAVEAEEVGEDTYFVAGSEAMHRIRGQVGMIAQVEVPVLIAGESGTGKEVVAKLIHKLSSRSRRMFMKVNCAALPTELLESELFGYEAGAFTGAVKAKPGKFELCDGGTILLDEIGEMSPALQAKLLHVLQDQSFSRLGGRSIITVDVRILAATNIDIPQALATKKLREDLYYRLNVFTLNIPPLRERREEVLILFRHFMSRFAQQFGREPLPLFPALADAALNYSWPGNLRELENVVKRYLILGDEGQILKDLRDNSAHGRGAVMAVASAAARTEPQGGDLKSLVRTLKGEAEMVAIRHALEATNWNRKEAARRLKISYKAILYKIRQHGLDKKTTPL